MDYRWTLDTLATLARCRAARILARQPGPFSLV